MTGPIKISQMATATTPDGTELVPMVQGSINKKITLANIFSTFAAFIASGLGARARTYLSKNRDWISVKDFGAIGDGSSHPLSDRYSTLAACQIDFPFVTSLSQSIDWAAFQAAVNSLSVPTSLVGGRIIVPAGSYFLSDTWTSRKRVTIEGTNSADQTDTAATLLTWPADTTGIRLYSVIDSGTSTGADYSRITGLCLTATSKVTSGVGIHATCVVYIDHCTIRSFKGHGVYLHGQTGGGATGICDVSSLTAINVVTCGGDGFRLEGNDTNVCTIQNCSSRTNGGYGYYDNGSYCNTYIACHEAGNTAGAYYNANATGLGGVYLGCYTEGGGTVTGTGDALILGGVMPFNGAAAGIRSSGGGLNYYCTTSNRHLWYRNNVEIGRIDTDNTLRTFAGAFFGSGGNAIDLTNSAVGRIDLTQTGTGSSTRVNIGNGNGTVGTITTSGSATAYNTSSDYRLKYDLKPMTGGIAKIMLLKPQTGKWKVDDAPFQGFVAHELQEVIPDAVSGVKDEMEEVEVKDEEGKVVETKTVPKHQGVDTSFVIPHIVCAMQEQQARIETLEAQVAQLAALLSAKS